LFSPLYSSLGSRLFPDRLMHLILLGGVVLYTSLWGMLHFKLNAFEYLPHVVFCIVESYIMFLLLHVWHLANALFTVWEGKRVFPVVGAAGLAGTVIGGGATHFISSHFGATTLFISWALLLAGVLATV